MTEPTAWRWVRRCAGGLRRALGDDDRVLLFGEDVGALGGVFRVTAGLAGEFGEGRVFGTPLGESGILGAALGLALRGHRPVVEVQFDGFVYPALDQLCTQVAHYRYRSEGACTVPLVLRLPYGGAIGAVEHHSESPEALFVATPGLRVLAPSDPVDAYGLLRAAVASDDPVVLLEPKRRYWDTAEVDLDAPPAPLDGARVLRRGTDCTVVGYGATTATCLAAADAAAEEGRDLEVVDLRSLAPLDVDTLAESVSRTGRCVVVSEAPPRCSVASEVAASVAEAAFWHLEAPVERVTGFPSPYPPARLEGHHVPDADRVLAAVDRALDAVDGAA